MTQPETDEQRAARHELNEPLTGAFKSATQRPKTPELDKVRQAREVGRSEEIGGFLEWLEGKGLHLCRYDEQAERWHPAHEGIQPLLAAYFEIDLVKVEQERMAVLEHVRKVNGIS